MRAADGYPYRWNLKHEILKVLHVALYDFRCEQPCIAPVKNKEFGDYYCNNVLTICLRKKPDIILLKDIAEAIKKNLPPNDMMEECCIQSSGYLTFKLSRMWIAKSIHKMLNDGIDAWAPKVYLEKAVIDFSSRNIADEMDVDHLRSTIIGDALLRMLEFCEVDVILKNHIGHHRGIQIGMLIEFLFESFRKGQTIGEFEVFYKESKKRFDEDAEFRKRAHQALVNLQIGKGKFLSAWTQICKMKRKSYRNVYQRLDVYMEEEGKHFYLPYIHETLDLLRQKGLIEKCEGDEVIFVEEKKKAQHESIERKKKRLTIAKKNEDYDNALTDLTSLRYQLKEEKPEWILYVADAGKEEYIEMCIAAARRAEWLPTDEDDYPKTKFVGYSPVQGDDLNRTGKLVDLLEDAKTRCKAALVKRGIPGKADEWTAEGLENTAEALAFGAVKYALLKNFRVFKHTFDFDEMLNDTGNTGVYLLYIHAQICSIINKSGRNIEDLMKTRELKLEKDEERELGLHLFQFTEILELACGLILPDHLCKYLYELSEKFTSFYSVLCQAAGGVNEDANRLLVCEATRVVMAKCFHLLGITPIGKISISEKTDGDDMMESSSDEDEDEDEEVMGSSSSSGEDKEDIVSSSTSGEEKTPAKRFKSSDLVLKEEEIKMISSHDPIKASDLTVEEEKEPPLKYPTPRFQLFSAIVCVDKYCADNQTYHKPCLLFGSISVSDLSVSSEKDGWIPTDDPEFGFVDLFNRDWYEPLPIINNGYISTLNQPRSIPVLDFLDIHMDLFVLGMEDDMFFQVSNKYRRYSLSDITYDHFSSHIARGPDGLVELVYIVLSDPVEADLEMTFITNPGGYDVLKQPLCAKIVAYYGGAADYEKAAYNITLLEDNSVTTLDKNKIPLTTSVLAVPAKGSLIIDVLITSSCGQVIIKDIFEFSAKLNGCSRSSPVKRAGCSFEMNVNWKYEAPT